MAAIEQVETAKRVQRTRPVAKLLESSNWRGDRAQVRGGCARDHKHPNNFFLLVNKLQTPTVTPFLLSIQSPLNHSVRLCWSPARLSGARLSTMASKLVPTRSLLRAQLTSRPANGHIAFIPQARKIVFEYCDKWPSSANTRTFLRNRLTEVARANPHVEFVVKQRTYKQPIVRGFYRE